MQTEPPNGKTEMQKTRRMDFSVVAASAPDAPGDREPAVESAPAPDLPEVLAYPADPGLLAAADHQVEARVLEQLQLRLDYLRRHEEVLATWAALPFLTWGGLTLAGCVYHFHFLHALSVALVVLAGCWLPFFQRHRWLKIGAGFSVAFNLMGWTVLSSIGGILTPSARQVLAWLSLIKRDEQSGAVIEPSGVPTPTTATILATTAVVVCVVVGLISLYQMVLVVVQARRKTQLQARIDTQAVRVRMLFEKQRATAAG